MTQADSVPIRRDDGVEPALTGADSSADEHDTGSSTLSADTSSGEESSTTGIIEASGRARFLSRLVDRNNDVVALRLYEYLDGELEVTLDRAMRGIGKFNCVARVAGEVVAEAAILCTTRPA